MTAETHTPEGHDAGKVPERARIGRVSAASTDVAPGATETLEGRESGVTKRVHVYTDGSYRCEDGTGGWAWVVGDKSNAGGCAVGGSSLAMEVRAVLEALRNLQGPLVIHCDNNTVTRLFSKAHMTRDAWLRGKRRKPGTLTHDLMLLTHRELAGRDVLFEHVYSHRHPQNSAADRLARTARLTWSKP